MGPGGEKQGHKLGFCAKIPGGAVTRQQLPEARAEAACSYLRVFGAFVIRENGCRGEKGAWGQGSSREAAPLANTPHSSPSEGNPEASTLTGTTASTHRAKQG